MRLYANRTRVHGRMNAGLQPKQRGLVSRFTKPNVYPSYKPMRYLLYLLPLLLCLQSSLSAVENASHLRGINFFYMNIDNSFAAEVTAMERLDLSDIMELQLRRGEIELRSYIANKPELNVPLIELSIDTSNRVSTGQFDLVLRVRDHVTIDRNKDKTVATTFELRRSARADANEVDTIKAELRELMSEFIIIFRQENP